MSKKKKWFLTYITHEQTCVYTPVYQKYENIRIIQWAPVTSVYISATEEPRKLIISKNKSHL